MRQGGNRDAARTLTIDEELRLLDWTYRNRSFRDYLVILTILRTGLRTNELREVLVSDICADGEILPHLEVRAEIAHNHKPRSILILGELRAQVQQFVRWKEYRGESITPTSFLFASAQSPQITVRHLQRIVRESTLGAFGKPYRAHDLRRTFGAGFLAQGNPRSARSQD